MRFRHKSARTDLGGAAVQPGGRFASNKGKIWIGLKALAPVRPSASSNKPPIPVSPSSAASASLLGCWVDGNDEVCMAAMATDRSLISFPILARSAASFLKNAYCGFRIFSVALLECCFRLASPRGGATKKKPVASNHPFVLFDLWPLQEAFLPNQNRPFAGNAA